MNKLNINKLFESMKDNKVSELIIKNGSNSYEIRSGGIINNNFSPLLHHSENEVIQKDNKQQIVLEIKSTLVGTYHESSEPGKDPFIKKGQTLCIIKAMNTFNDIKSDVNGIIKKIYLKNLEIVGYGKLLFKIEKI